MEAVVVSRERLVEADAEINVASDIAERVNVGDTVFIKAVVLNRSHSVSHRLIHVKPQHTKRYDGWGEISNSFSIHIDDVVFVEKKP